MVSVEAETVEGWSGTGSRLERFTEGPLFALL